MTDMAFKLWYGDHVANGGYLGGDPLAPENLRLAVRHMTFDPFNYQVSAEIWRAYHARLAGRPADPAQCPRGMETIAARIREAIDAGDVTIDRRA